LKYEELLEKAYKALPAKAITTERYEMPKVDSISQGNKTIIRNFRAIIDNVRREQVLVAKYFSKELAVPSSLEGDRLILYGKFNERVLNEKLTNFVNSQVLCSECKKPDTRRRAANRKNTTSSGRRNFR